MGIDHTDDVSDVFKYEYYYAYNVGVLFPVPPVESPFSAALRVLCIGDNVAHLRQMICMICMIYSHYSS